MAWTKRASLHLVTGLALALSTQPAWSEASNVGTVVRCAAGKSFTVQVSARRAIVQFGQKRMSLPQKDMPLGQYYRNADAALVIDGDFVAFVPKGDEGWRECRLSPQTTVSN